MKHFCRLFLGQYCEIMYKPCTNHVPQKQTVFFFVCEQSDGFTWFTQLTHSYFWLVCERRQSGWPILFSQQSIYYFNTGVRNPCDFTFNTSLHMGHKHCSKTVHTGENRSKSRQKCSVVCLMMNNFLKGCSQKWTMVPSCFISGNESIGGSGTTDIEFGFVQQTEGIQSWCLRPNLILKKYIWLLWKENTSWNPIQVSLSFPGILWETKCKNHHHMTDNLVLKRFCAWAHCVTTAQFMFLPSILNTSDNSLEPCGATDNIVDTSIATIMQKQCINSSPCLSLKQQENKISRDRAKTFVYFYFIANFKRTWSLKRTLLLPFGWVWQGAGAHRIQEQGHAHGKHQHNRGRGFRTSAQETLLCCPCENGQDKKGWNI